MAEELNLLYRNLKDIRTYLVKIGPERRKGNELNKKLDEANTIYKQLPNIIDIINKQYENDEIDRSEITIIKELSEEIRNLHQEILNFKSSSELASKMSMSAVDFFNLASKLVPIQFDGNQNQIVTFLDAIELLKANCAQHEPNAVAFVKTRLSGKARDLITSENTLEGIIATLKKGLRFENSQVIASKLHNLKQNTKDSAQYASEIESLAHTLKRAFISEGVPTATADNYTVNEVVRTLSKNANSDKARIVMEAGTFSTLQDALSKFTRITPDTTSSAGVYYYKRNYRSDRYNNYNRGRGQHTFNGQYRPNQINQRGSFSQNRARAYFSSSHRSNRGNSYQNHRGNFRNVRYASSTEPIAGNDQNPQPVPLGVTNLEAYPAQSSSTH